MKTLALCWHCQMVQAPPHHRPHSSCVASLPHPTLQGFMLKPSNWSPFSLKNKYTKYVKLCLHMPKQLPNVFCISAQTFQIKS